MCSSHTLIIFILIDQKYVLYLVCVFKKQQHKQTNVKKELVIQENSLSS